MVSEDVRYVIDHNVLALPRPEWGCLRVWGPDRKSWLHGLLTADLLALTPAEGAFSLLLTRQGKILTTSAVLEANEQVYVSTDPGTREQAHAFLEEYLIMEDAELELHDGLSWVTLHGMRAAEVMAKVASQVSVMAGGSVPFGGAPSGALVFEQGKVEAVSEALMREGVRIASEDNGEAARCALGLPELGVDFSHKDSPHQASLERRAISWSKGCYLGQEAVCMQDMRGKLKRRLVRLQFGGAGVASGTPVTKDGQPVGEVTTATILGDPPQGCAIARLSAPHFQPGSQVEIAGQSALVAEL